MKKVFKHSKFTAIFTDEDGYFSFTGDCDGGSGAVGNRIVEIEPRLKLLNDMHLANSETGAPMYALENAFYHFEQHVKNDNRPVKSWDAAFKVLEDYWKVELNGEQKAKLRLNMTNGKIITPSAADCGADGKPLFKGTKEVVTEIMEEISDQWEKKALEVYDLVDEIESNMVGTFVNPFDGDGNYLSDEYENHLAGYDTEEQNKIIALAMHEDVDVCEVDQASYGDHHFKAAGREYLVVTDDEGDELWNEDLENYIDDCLEIPENMQNYFDREGWKRDARIDGRAHSLARYDGNEYTETVDGETYYIYRQ